MLRDCFNRIYTTEQQLLKAAEAVNKLNGNRHELFLINYFLIIRSESIGLTTVPQNHLIYLFVTFYYEYLLRMKYLEPMSGMKQS